MAVGEGRQSADKENPNAEVVDLGPQLDRGGGVRGEVLRQHLLCLCDVEAYTWAASYRASQEAMVVGSCVFETWGCDRHGTRDGDRDTGRVEGRNEEVRPECLRYPS